MAQVCFVTVHLGIETVVRRLLARTDMVWNLKKMGQVFSIFNNKVAKITKAMYG